MNKHNRDWRQAVSPTAERSNGPAFRSSDCATFTKFSGPPLSPENSGVSEWTAEFAGFVLHGLLRTLQHHRRATIPDIADPHRLRSWRELENAKHVCFIP